MGDISPRGLAMIKDYESYSAEAYLCPEGVPTIGFGSIRWDARTPVKLGDKCTLDQAEQLILKEIRRIEDAIDSYVTVPLTQGQFDCLCSWAYNVGIGWITGVGHAQATLIKYLNRGQYEKVPSELLKFKRGAVSGKSLNGLLNRRKREIAELWLHDGEAPATVTEKAMPQAVVPDAPHPVAVVVNSGTGKAAGIGIIGMLIQAWNWSFGAVKEAGVEAVGNQQALGPFEALFKALGANMGLLTALIIAGTLTIVVMRKIAQERS